jgi:MFS family permease
MLRRLTINRWSVFAAFTTAYFLSQFFRSANAVIAPNLVDTFSLSPADMGLMSSLFFAAFAITQFPLGVALDRWGPRWVTAGLMTVAVVGSLVFAQASTFAMLALGRVLLGIGLAGILMGGLKAFSQWFPKERFASAAGLLGGIGALGGLVAATPMAWLNEHYGWRTIFAAGSLVLALSVLFLLVGSRNRPPHTAPEPSSAMKKGANVHLLAIFGTINFWRIAAPVAWIAGFGMAFRGLWAAPYLLEVYQLSHIETGNLLLLLGIGGMAGSVLVGWTTERVGIAKVVITSCLVLIVCQAILASLPPLWIVVIVYVTMGLAGGFPAALLAQARRLFPAHMTGQVLSMVNMTGFAGTFLLQWWMGELLAYFPASTTGHSLPQGYGFVLAFTAAVSILALFVYLPLALPRQDASAVPTQG